MTLKQYQVVRLTTDCYRDRGVGRAALGTILEIYGDDAYEVEFTRPDGTTIDWFAVAQNEVELAPESAAVRSPRE